MLANALQISRIWFPPLHLLWRKKKNLEGHMYVQIYYIWIIKFFLFCFFSLTLPSLIHFLQRIVILMFSCDVDHLIIFAANLFILKISVMQYLHIKNMHPRSECPSFCQLLMNLGFKGNTIVGNLWFDHRFFSLLLATC